MNEIQDFLRHKVGDAVGKSCYFPIGVANLIYQKARSIRSSYPDRDNGEIIRRHFPRQNSKTEFGFCSLIQEFSSSTDITKTLDVIENVNGRWLRTEFPYKKHKNYFEKTDKIVDEAQKRGIKVLPVIGNWVTGSMRMPRKMGDYLEYVEDVVGRYAGKVGVYNVFNEPNSFGFWLDSREEFAHLFKETRKKMHETDPNALAAVNISWQWGALDFIRSLENERALKHVDVLGLDSYPGSYELGNAHSWRDKIRETRKCLKSLGHEDIDVWVFEYGFYAYPQTKLSSHTPQAQTRFFRDATKVISSEDVPVATWYCLNDITQFPRKFQTILPQEHHFGILKRDYTPKDPKIFDAIRSLT